jgi:RND family efflux transporter MFP subunit
LSRLHGSWANAHRIRWEVVSVCGFACSVFLSGCHHETPSLAAIPPTKVTAAVPVETETVDFHECTGRIDAVESVEIRSRVTGYLEKINFYDGAEVKKGDVLYQIDDRPFKATLDQASAQVKLREADLTYRLSELKRAEPLVSQNAVSKSDFDQIVASHAQAIAALAAAKADEESARLNVEYTTLRAPIDGETSRSQITKGNLVQADQTVLTTIVSTDPMYVYFDMDEPTILKIQEQIREGKIHVKKDELTPVWVALDDDKGFRHEGMIDFAENRMDASTGTIRVRAKLSNPTPEVGHRMLFPDLFARIRIPMNEPAKTLMVAERAIMSDQGQKCVYIVNDKNEVEYRAVSLGKLENRMRAITGGLTLKDRVIVTGLQRVRPGETVDVKMVDMNSFANPTAKASEKSNAATDEKAAALQDAKAGEKNGAKAGEKADGSGESKSESKSESGDVAAPKVNVVETSEPKP